MALRFILGGLLGLLALPIGCALEPARIDEAALGYLKRADCAAREAEARTAVAPEPEIRPVGERGDLCLTLGEAIRRALAGNHEIQIASYDPAIAEEDVVRAEAAFDTVSFLSNTFGRTNRPIQSVLDTGLVGDDTLIEDTWQFQGGVRQLLPTGGTVALYEDLNYLDTNSTLTMPNPQYRAGLGVELAQPILKGAGARINRAAIRVANLNADMSRGGFRWTVMDVLTRITNAYWQLAYEIESVRVSRDTVDMAREVLRREKVRVESGISKDMDVARARAALAEREGELVRAENRVRLTMDRLKLLLNSADAPLDADCRLLPADPLRAEPTQPDRGEAVALALANRPDIENARTAVAINRIRLDVADRERLPKLDAVLRYTMNGLGENLGRSMGDQHAFSQSDWTAGLEFEVPLGNRDAQASHRKRLFEYEQSLVQADRVVAQSIQEVNLAVRTIETATREVEVTHEAVLASDQTRKGEQIRFELGERTNEELLRAQDRLAAAERAHLMALLGHNLARIELARAQGTLLEAMGIEVVGPEEGEEGRPGPVRARMQAD